MKLPFDFFHGFLILPNLTGHHEEDDGGRGRYLRSCANVGASYHHPHELHPVYDSMEAAEFDRHYQQQRPVDLGYNNRSYSPGAAAAVAAAAAASDGWSTHHLVPGPDWIDASRAGQHAAAGLAWPPHSHDQRYLSPNGSSKWEVASHTSVSSLAGGNYKKSTKSKMNSEGGSNSASCGNGSVPNEFIPDETLQHLTVKELNKRVQNLARDEVVALKQRRRTLKNRG